MKKIILSLALIAGMTAMTNLQRLNASNQIQSEVAVQQDEDGFVEVKLENLTPEVQEVVKSLLADNDLKHLKYNAEKQLTKVILTSKDNQTEKIVLLDAEAKELTLDPVIIEDSVSVDVDGQQP